jgi:hypothetical protein
LCILISAACAPLRQITAEPGDFAAYRAYRTGSTLERRLSAAQRYLREYPDGRWGAEVEAWFLPAEERYWARARTSLPRLRTYLEVLPGGPHAGAAVRRARELILERAYARDRERDLLARAAAIEADLARAERGRRDVLVTFVRFVDHLSRVRSFGQRTSALDHRLIFDWRLTPPYGSCVLGSCRKALALDYAIPEDRQIVQRMALFDVVFELDRGDLRRALVTGPELFSRVFEAVSLRPVRPDDLQARVDAIARTLELVRNTVESALPEARCGVVAVSPVVLERRCDGVRFVVVPASAPDEEDRIWVEPAALEPGPLPAQLRGGD